MSINFKTSRIAMAYVYYLYEVMGVDSVEVCSHVATTMNGVKKLRFWVSYSV